MRTVALIDRMPKSAYWGGGIIARKGGIPGVNWGRPNSPCGQNSHDTSKNITLARTSLRPVNIRLAPPS